MVDIRPNQLPSAITPLRETDALIVDQGTDGVRKTTPSALTDSVAPVATQAEAIAGSDNVKRMTSLRTKQSIASEVGVTIASNSQGAKADSAVQTVNGKSGNSVTLDKVDVGLGNVSNLTPADMPISTATQSALNLKANDSVVVKSVNGITPISGNVDVPARFVFGEVDITDYGYTIGSSTGFASAVNSAISYLVSIGGGIARVPTGTHTLDDTIVMQSKCYIVGNGSGSTIIKSKDSLNKNMITTKDSSSLFGGNTSGGEAYWGIFGVTLHGNKDNNTSGNSIYTYSRVYNLNDVRIFFSAENGIKSEWYTGAVNWTQPGFENTDRAMEAQIHNVHVHYSRNNGIDWNGPHDSQFSNVIVAQSSHDSPGTYDGFTIGPSSGGLQAVNVHSWGDLQRYAFNLRCGYLHFSNCEADDARSALVNWQGDNICWYGGVQFGAVFSEPPQPHDLTLKGFIIGGVSTPVNNPRIDTSILNCPAGAINFVNLIGSSGCIRVSGRLTNASIIPGSVGYTGSVPSQGVEINININNAAIAPTLVREAGIVSAGPGSASFPNITANSNQQTGINISSNRLTMSVGGVERGAYGINWMKVPTAVNVDAITEPWTEGMLYVDIALGKIRAFISGAWRDLN